MNTCTSKKYFPNIDNYHMHPDNLPSDEDNIWSDEDILSSVDPALLTAIEDDGLSHSYGHSEAGLNV